mmetsp:Transcript_60234/g.168150  ORF Transcript_60234/g.168150 Transcript_60234/m.168150 type:complete len:115 (+) Transcript_60234:445-789(+)
MRGGRLRPRRLLFDESARQHADVHVAEEGREDAGHLLQKALAEELMEEAQHDCAGRGKVSCRIVTAPSIPFFCDCCRRRRHNALPPQLLTLYPEGALKSSLCRTGARWNYLAWK